jgi:hypothetical protein
VQLLEAHAGIAFQLLKIGAMLPLRLAVTFLEFLAARALNLLSQVADLPVGSRDKPAQNADGSTDLYFGSKAPEGREANWLATVPGKGYFAILRLYGPTEASFNKSWKPGDFEMVK